LFEKEEKQQQKQPLKNKKKKKVSIFFLSIRSFIIQLYFATLSYVLLEFNDLKA